MRMPKLLLSIAAATATALASCSPPEPVPPPRFRPNPPYAPLPVDPYGQPYDPYGQNTDIAPPAPPSPETVAPTRPGEYPIAKGTDKAGEVISPYEPFNVIDVSDCRPGQLARDPHNMKIFRVP